MCGGGAGGWAVVLVKSLLFLLNFRKIILHLILIAQLTLSLLAVAHTLWGESVDTPASVEQREGPQGKCVWLLSTSWALARTVVDALSAASLNWLHVRSEWGFSKLLRSWSHLD